MSITTLSSQEDRIAELKSRGIKVIGFDLDGTLYPQNEEINNAIQQYFLTKAAAKLGKSIKETRQLWQEKYEKGGGARQALIDIGVPDGPEIVQEALNNTDITKFLKEDPNATAVLLALRTKYKIDLITGSNEELARKKLEKLNIPLEFFDERIYGDLDKSNGTAYLEWIRLYGKTVPTSEMVYIGDNAKADIEKPQELGITGILLDPKGKSQADCIRISTLKDLNQILLG